MLSMSFMFKGRNRTLSLSRINSDEKKILGSFWQLLYICFVWTTKIGKVLQTTYWCYSPYRENMVIYPECQAF